MSRSFDTVIRLNAAAKQSGAADSVLQFENITTHAQYEKPYEITGRYVTPGAHVLDWGCGNGHFSLLLESLGARVTGFSFEPPPRALAASSSFTFVQGNEAEPARLPFDDASFDVAVGVGVLEHVWETGGDERASLAELARVVKPGGTLLTFHLPNRTGWVERMVKLLRLKKHFHHRKYSAPEIRALWSDASFAVTELGLYNAFPRSEIRHLPGALRHNRVFAAGYSALDDLIAAVAPSVCTNFYVAARREPSPAR